VLIDVVSMSLHNNDLLEMASSCLTSFHGGFSICCQRCRKHVFTVGEMPWEYKNMKEFEGANYCLDSMQTKNTLVLVPDHVLLLDAGMIVRASNCTIGFNGFHSPLSPIDDKFCKDCCIELAKKGENKGEKPKDIESIKMKYSQVYQENVDLIKSLHLAEKNGYEILRVGHKCDCKKLCVHKNHVCKRVMTANYSLKKIEKDNAKNVVRVLFMPMGTSASTDREGLQIWILNTIGVNAIRYSTKSIKSQGNKKSTVVTISSSLISQKVVARECVGQSYTNTCSYSDSDNVIRISTSCEDLKCAACGQGTFSKETLRSLLPNIGPLLPFEQMRPMVWMEGFFNTFHLDTCVQTCQECDMTLVPRYGASKTQLDANPQAKCVPLDCPSCVAKKQMVEMENKEHKHQVTDRQFNEKTLEETDNHVRVLEHEGNQEQRQHKRMKLDDGMTTSKNFLIHCKFLPFYSIQSSILSGSIASTSKHTIRKQDVPD
jgi:hypothetical protein